MNTRTPTDIEQALVALQECVCKWLAEKGAGPTCWCGVYPGTAVSWEFCGECSGGKCGMGYIQVRQSWPWNDWPYPLQEANCFSPIGYTVAVGAVRCMPVGDDDGEPPTVEELTETAMDQMADRHALLCAVRECLPSKHSALVSYQPLGPQGGCVGGEWLVQVDPSY